MANKILEDLRQRNPFKKKSATAVTAEMRRTSTSSKFKKTMVLTGAPPHRPEMVPAPVPPRRVVCVALVGSVNDFESRTFESAAAAAAFAKGSAAQLVSALGVSRTKNNVGKYKGYLWQWEDTRK